MNWKVISLLSLFGLAMGYITVYWVPTKVEPFLWLPIFAFSAYIIGRYAGRRYFLHGFLTGLANCVWMTALHIGLSAPYLSHHAKEAAQYARMQAENGGTLVQAMLFTNIFAGVLSGIVLGLFAMMGAKYIKSTAPRDKERI